MENGDIQRRHCLSTYKSTFLKQGEIIEPKISSFSSPSNYFNLCNFEICKENNQLQVIGSGAFGNVYLAKSKKDNKLYAIKHVKKSSVIECGAEMEIMYREINIQMKLSHPNIIRLYSYNETQKDFSLLMEYLDNGTLFTYIRKNKQLSEDTAFNFFIQVANAIYFLHENNFVHRDIKPENILLDKDNNVKLCDFGWCVDMNGGERTTFCGTYEYMAPEIVMDKPYDKSIDVWALGVLLYEMTHGYSPFRAKESGGEEYEEIFRKILKKNPPIDKNLGLSNECCDLINKLLNKNRKERMKVNEVFKHPWVKKYEEKKKKEKINKVIEVAKPEPIKKEIVNKEENVMIAKPLVMENKKKDIFDDVLNNVKKLNKKKGKKKKKDHQQVNSNINFSKSSHNLKATEKLPQAKPIIPSVQSSSNVNNIYNTYNTTNRIIQKKKIVITSHNNINNYFYNNDMNDDIFYKERDRTAASSKKKGKHFSTYSGDEERDNTSEMINTIKMLEKAERVKEETEKNYTITESNLEDESFWDKIFKIFKCGKNGL